MKTYLDFNLEPIKKVIREVMNEKGEDIPENKMDSFVAELMEAKEEVPPIKVSCLVCGIKFPLNDLEHDCQKEDIWLHEYIKCSKGTKEIPKGCKTKLRKKYPLLQRNRMIFRGINFDTKEQYEQFMEQAKEGTYHFETISSWTTDYSKAHSFARFIMKGTRENEEIRKIALEEMINKRSNITGYKGVVIGTDVLKRMVLCDISENSIGNMDEKEIILVEGVHPITVMKVIERVEGASNWDIDVNNLHEVLKK